MYVYDVRALDATIMDRECPPTTSPVAQLEQAFIKLARTVGPALFVVTAVIHVTVILRFAVNIPYYDEWHYFSTEGLGKVPTLRWIFARDNEHFIVPMHLITWGWYLVNGWRVAPNLAANFLLFLCIPLSLYGIAQRHLGNDAPILWPFLWFLLSPLNFENHSWAFQSAWHLNALLTLGACWFLLTDGKSGLALLAGWACAVVAMFTMATGVVTALVLVAAVAADLWMDRRHITARDIVRVSLAGITIGVLVTLWLATYARPAHHPPVTPPVWVFWDYYLNLISLGIGLTRIEWIPGAVTLAAVLGPMIMIGIERWGKPTFHRLWFLWVFTFIQLASLALISAGRAEFGIGQAKSSRYFEMASLLVPLGVIAWLEWRPSRSTRLGLITCWVILVVFFANHWTDESYRDRSRLLQRGQACVAEYYRSGVLQGRCHGLYPETWPVEGFVDGLERAKRLGMSFTKID